MNCLHSYEKQLLWYFYEVLQPFFFWEYNSMTISISKIAKIHVNVKTVNDHERKIQDAHFYFEGNWR